MAHDPSRGRSPYHSPDAVLAEAQRIAADIRRRAEREANAIRREAAEWASATRQEAERHRERVLAELAHARAVAEDAEEAEDTPAGEPVEPVEVSEASEPVAPATGPGHAPVIDLRIPTEAHPVRLVIVPPTPDDDDDVDGDDENDEAEAAEAAEAEAHHRPAVGGTYVVGRPLPAPGTSIETKVHDVVRLAVRRTFHRRFP